jgi:hypothetical protein
LEREGKQEDEGRVWRKRRKEEGKVAEEGGRGGGRRKSRKGEGNKETRKQDKCRIKDMKEKD